MRSEESGDFIPDTPLADPERLWPRGVVEYKFWRDFDPGFPSIYADWH